MLHPKDEPTVVCVWVGDARHCQPRGRVVHVSAEHGVVPWSDTRAANHSRDACSVVVEEELVGWDAVVPKVVPVV